jgi:hypothetical protein
MKHLSDDELVDLIKADPVPEPSPLFWDQFARQVNARIDAGPAPAAPWFAVTRLVYGAFALVVVALVAVTVWRETDGLAPVPAPAAVGEVAEFQPRAFEDLDEDADWAIVRAVADDLDLDEARGEGLGPRPGMADRMALELSDEERAELIRLVQEEIKAGA